MEGQTRGQGEGTGRNGAGLLKLGIKDGGGLGDSEDQRVGKWESKLDKWEVDVGIVISEVVQDVSGRVSG